MSSHTLRMNLRAGVLHRLVSPCGFAWIDWCLLPVSPTRKCLVVRMSPISPHGNKVLVDSEGMRMVTRAIDHHPSFSPEICHQQSVRSTRARESCGLASSASESILQCQMGILANLPNFGTMSKVGGDIWRTTLTTETLKCRSHSDGTRVLVSATSQESHGRRSTLIMVGSKIEMLVAP